MDIFLSYSHAQRTVAESLALSLRGQGHEVFYDWSSIEPGEEYDQRIRNAIEACDLFVFLISPESVAPGSYALAEVGFAQEKWDHPKGHVLPILAARTPIQDIPPYLRAVSILKPRGDLVAEASAAVARLGKGGGQWRTAAAIVAALAFLSLLGIFGYRWIETQRAGNQEAARIVRAAELDIEAGQYEGAFNALKEAAAKFPEDASVRGMQIRAAHLWLRNIRVTVGKQSFTDVVNTVRPFLLAAALKAQGAEAADMLAHLGWCEYLRVRDGGEGDPAVYFRRAIESDALNPYAHAMWGFWIMFRRDAVADVRSHFREAAASGRERQWVENLHLSTFLLNRDEALEAEAIGIADTMRQEQLMVDQPYRLWSVYQLHLLDKRRSEVFVKALPPETRAMTFQWLFPESGVDADRLFLYRFMLGRLLEADGQHDEALAAYRAVEAHGRQEKASGSLFDRTAEGIARLTKSPTPRG